ncbi:MAG: hypothetical protein U0V54_10180 [Saprospiraceae bacterium]
MKIRLKSINEEKYKQSSSPILFEDKRCDRSFAFLTDELIEYKFGWQSDLIEPELRELSDTHCSIGIDLDFIILEFKTGKIEIKLSLNSFFYETKVIKEMLYVIGEYEIIVINLKNFQISEIEPLPDAYQSMEVTDDNIIISTLEGHSIVYTPPLS